MAKINPKFFRAIAALTIPLSLVLPSFNSYGEVPDSAKVTQIVGTNSLGIRRDRSRKYTPVSVGAVMRQRDKLDIPNNGKVFARLDFFNNLNQFMGLAIQATIKNQSRTSYYFPCYVNAVDDFIIEWTNEKTGKRACEKGLRVASGTRSMDELLKETYPSILKSVNLKQLFVAQASPSQWQHCSVGGNSGQGWLGVATSDPCQQPMEACQAKGESQCTILNLDRWTNQETDLTALVTCANNQEFSEKGTGATMQELVPRLWQEAQSQGATVCALHVFTLEDAIVEPLPSQESSLVELRNADPCFTFDVYSGTVNAYSTTQPKGVPLKKGDRYFYCQEREPDGQEKFDPATESINVQIFRAKERGYRLCDEEQASGGQEGDTRTIQLTATTGVIQIDYEMYQVPDRLRIIYEGNELLNTEFVSGRNSVSVPFDGKSGQVTVELTGNIEISSTRWNYTLRCPQDFVTSMKQKS